MFALRLHWNGRHSWEGTTLPDTKANRAKLQRLGGCRHRRDPFISVALTKGLNPKFIADCCGTSVAMIERHYARFLEAHADAQLRLSARARGVAEGWPKPQNRQPLRHGRRFCTKTP